MVDVLLDRLVRPRGLIQVLSGPRQAGKTTIATQVLDALGLPSRYASADDPAGQDLTWLRATWEEARRRAEGGGAVLVLDEIQKIDRWSDLVKALWDEDVRQGTPLQVVILGSAPLLMHRGLSESLAGRFELIRVPHWSFGEMREAFGWTVDQYVYFGGYPRSASLIKHPDEWRLYIRDSLIETTISRDILVLQHVAKPALLRRLFGLACDYSGQVLSYQKMVGQLQDAGNASTLAHYLDLLSSAGMVTGLQKYSGSKIRQRASSPKLVVLNTALMSAGLTGTITDARRDPAVWGRLVETAAGAHLMNGLWGSGVDVMYWREGNTEVDYVLRSGGDVAAIEVTSGRRKGSLPGFAALSKVHPLKRTLLVGAQGISIEEFLVTPPTDWLR